MATKTKKKKAPTITWTSKGASYGHATALDALRAIRDAIDTEIRLVEAQAPTIKARVMVPDELRFSVRQVPNEPIFSLRHEIGRRA